MCTLKLRCLCYRHIKFRQGEETLFVRSFIILAKSLSCVEQVNKGCTSWHDLVGGEFTNWQGIWNLTPFDNLIRKIMWPSFIYFRSNYMHTFVLLFCHSPPSSSLPPRVSSYPYLGTHQENYGTSLALHYVSSTLRTYDCDEGTTGQPESVELVSGVGRLLRSFCPSVRKKDISSTPVRNQTPFSPVCV